MDKRFLRFRRQLLQLFSLIRFSQLALHAGNEAQGIVPKGVKLHDVACTGHDRQPVGSGVHPGDGLFAPVGIEQSVIVESQIGMVVAHDVMHDVADQPSIELLTALATHLLGILLGGPYRPEGYVGLLHLANFSRRRLPLHQLAEPFGSRPHDQLKILPLLTGECQAGQGDEGVAGAALEPWITGDEVLLALLGTVMKLVGGIEQTVDEVVTGDALIALFLENAGQRRGVTLGG